MTPKAARRIHLFFMLVWGIQMIGVLAIMWPPGWKMYLIEISLAANFIGHWSGLSAERPSETI